MSSAASIALSGGTLIREFTNMVRNVSNEDHKAVLTTKDSSNDTFQSLMDEMNTTSKHQLQLTRQEQQTMEQDAQTLLRANGAQAMDKVSSDQTKMVKDVLS